jgi:hypothetical protein
MSNSAWTWLGKENNRSALILIGSALAAVASAAWAIYTYERPADSRPLQTDSPAEPVPAQPVQRAIAENGGIAINADGNASVSVHQTKP